MLNFSILALEFCWLLRCGPYCSPSCPGTHLPLPHEYITNCKKTGRWEDDSVWVELRVLALAGCSGADSTGAEEMLQSQVPFRLNC